MFAIDRGKGAVQKRVSSLQELRRLLSRSEFPPIESALKAGAVPILEQCLSFGSPDEQVWNFISFEYHQFLLWMSCTPQIPEHTYLRACYTDHMESLVAKKLLTTFFSCREFLLQLLEAAWCLTNIAAGNPEETKALLPALPLLIAHLGGEWLLWHSFCMSRNQLIFFIDICIKIFRGVHIASNVKVLWDIYYLKERMGGRELRQFDLLAYHSFF